MSEQIPHLTIEKLDEVYMRVFGDASIEQELADFFTYEYPGARFTPQYKARLWDGKVRLYDQVRKTIYIGLLQYIEKFCERNDYLLTHKGDSVYTEQKYTHDNIEGFVKTLKLPEKIEIRDYQIDAIAKGINDERTLLLSPTGSGKSFIIYSLMRKRWCMRGYFLKDQKQIGG